MGTGTTISSVNLSILIVNVMLHMAMMSGLVVMAVYF